MLSAVWPNPLVVVEAAFLTWFSPLPSRVIGTAEVPVPEGLGLNGYNTGRQKLSRER